MSPSAVTEHTPEAAHHKKPRLRGHRRALTVASMLLALVGGAIADSGAASAQTVPTLPGSCTQTCNRPPSGVNQADWDDALDAADFWANHEINVFAVVRYRLNSYYRLDFDRSRGWPGARQGNQWLGFWNGAANRDQFVYYGGTFNDYQGLVTTIEQARGVSASRAYQTSRQRTAPYVEYDISYWNQPWGVPNRGSWRLVRNPNSGNVYVTFDHYTSFYYLGHF
ncbi:hypothetical protein [Streptomyces sp. NPDC091217]|uniref:hypothetical protein n=1 Tax=Streptomyces sp. NPDC091217 TaxID=3365975 RepID=UPI0037F71DB2